jgi:hypothetical protein
MGAIGFSEIFSGHSEMGAHLFFYRDHFPIHRLALGIWDGEQSDN